MRKLGKRAVLAQQIEYVRGAVSASDLEDRFQSARKVIEEAHGSIWARSHHRASESLRWDAVVPRGRELAAVTPLGRFVPVLNARRRLVVAGQEYSVGFGGNGAGERYAWHNAHEFISRVLASEGLPAPLIKEVNEWALGWPHRALRKLEESIPRRSKLYRSARDARNGA